MSKRKCLKKYANGTGVHGYIEDPATTMAKNDIMIAKADQRAMNNPWIPITMMAGQVLSSVISSGAKGGGGATGGSNYSVSGQDTALNIPVDGMSPIAANGKTNAQGQVEAEDGEVIETPGGEAQELKGASHEQGGIDINIPPGTRIFSDRIIKEGKTMAERKKSRERKLKNLEELLGHKDIAIVNSATRTKAALDKEEQEDLRLQEIADKFANMTAQFAYGTGPEGINPYTITKNKDGVLDFTDPNAMGYLLPKPPTADDWKGVPYAEPDLTPDLTGLQPKDNTITLTDEQVANKNGEYDGYSNPELAPTGPELIDKPGTVLSRTLDKAGKAIEGTYMPTGGDMIGLIGDLISTFGPMKNTLANRAGDTPNVNKFEDFGKDALKANADAMGYVASQKDNALKRIVDNSNGSKRAARNSARGVNTMRALDLGIDLAANEAGTGVSDAFARQMMELLGHKAQLENTQDQVVMAGEQEKDLNNRKDRDNFYTQKAKDIATMGTGVQQTGKDINSILKNPVYLNLLNEMGKYFTVDNKGNVIAKKTT